MAQVHRAASVYTPRTVAIVNAATRDQIERIERAGGASRALEWILSGMTTRSIEQSPTGEATLRSILARIAVDRHTEHLRHAIGGDVTVGRPDPAGGEDICVAMPELIECVEDRSLLIADHPHFLEIDTDRRQIFRDIADVLVLGSAGQESCQRCSAKKAQGDKNFFYLCPGAGRGGGRVVLKMSICIVVEVPNAPMVLE